MHGDDFEVWGFVLGGSGKGKGRWMTWGCRMVEALGG